MFKVLTFLMILSSVGVFAQTEDSVLIAEIETFRQELNHHYINKETSPFRKKRERKKFKGHQFYPIDLSYRVEARISEFLVKDTIIIPTSAGTEKKFRRYCELSFILQGIDCKLVAYQRAKEGLDNYLFVPFKDLTSGFDSYGGGRYLDLELPKGSDAVVLDFNYAYNPYCAYTTGWFCPIPPEENFLNVEVRAGLMKPDAH